MLSSYQAKFYTLEINQTNVNVSYLSLKIGLGPSTKCKNKSAEFSKDRPDAWWGRVPDVGRG